MFDLVTAVAAMGEGLFIEVIEAEYIEAQAAAEDSEEEAQP